MNLGSNIKDLRIQKKLTQEELAQILGTSSKSVSRWEQNITAPDITLLPFIANIFEVSVDELLGVEHIKQDEYLKTVKSEAIKYAQHNDYENELKLWMEAYKKFPNNDEIKVSLINIMNTINIIKNEIKYSNEVIRLAESILEKSSDNLIRLEATKILVELYSQMNNIKMAENYAKKLPNNLFLTRNVMETRYLKDANLLTAIQMNVSEFMTEIMRESEFIIYDNRIKMSNEYKKEYLERSIKIEELFFVKDGDYGYDAIPIIFSYIKLAKLEIITTNSDNLVKQYLINVTKAVNYVIDFKPHIIKSPFMNNIKCETISGYSGVSSDLKQNILNELTSEEFNQYKQTGVYLELLCRVEAIVE